MKAVNITGRVLLHNFKYISLILVVLLVAFSFYSKYKPTRADSNDLTLTNGDYSIDDNGNVYQRQHTLDLKEKGYVDSTSQSEHSISPQYYSYLFNHYIIKGLPVSINSSTNLIVGSGATVMMEGSQDLANLTVKGGGRITQPMADRYGNINRPVYTKDYWGATFTGFFKLEANSKYYLGTSGNVDDFISIEIGNGETADSSANWNVVYRSHDGNPSNGWDNVNTSLRVFKTSFQNDSVAYKKLLENSTSSPRYVPIKISFADSAGLSYLYLYYNKYASNTNPAIWIQSTKGLVARNSFCGIGTDGKVALSGSTCSKPSTVNFDYYISQRDRAPSYGFANGIRTAGRTDLNLADAFAGGYGDYGDVNSNFSDKMYFRWDKEKTPFGNTVSNHSKKRAFRYSGQLLNQKIFQTSRMIKAGLTLNVSEKTSIESGYGINLAGTGYPGYSAEFGGSNPSYSAIRGGSLNFDGSPGGGYSNIISCMGATGGGGSHAGQGGYLDRGDNHCNVDKRPDSYGDESDPTTLGSGGGGATENTDSNIAGSGGGALKLVTGDLNIESNVAIVANGDSGEYAGWRTNTGGAGGSINLTINGHLSITGSVPAISADGASGQPSWIPAANNFDWHVGGGGGYIFVNYKPSNSNRPEQANLTNDLSVAGGRGGKRSDYGATDEIADGTAGKIKISTNTICPGGENLVVTKRTLAEDGKLSATFEAGDKVRVELTVTEPTEQRDDFIIEDTLPATVADGTTILVTLRHSLEQSQKNVQVAGGKIKIEGYEDFQLTQGDNTLSYSYSL